MEKTVAAPTGCYKCGRPGHWSRDCPDSNPNPNPNPNSANLTHSIPSRSFPSKSGSHPKAPAAAEKPKKVPRSRPKLTPELLVGEDGLGYILRHFPRNFRFRGRGHEVSDLGNLIGLYKEWHSRLLPYYSFDQFVHKVEQVAASRRVKTCIADLRERVARGGDPAKLHESPSKHIDPDTEPAPAEAMNFGEPCHKGDPSSEDQNADPMQEDMLHEIYDRAKNEPCQVSQSDAQFPDQDSEARCFSDVLITEEQRTRMEANRLKALERAAARSRSHCG